MAWVNPVDNTGTGQETCLMNLKPSRDCSKVTGRPRPFLVTWGSNIFETSRLQRSRVITRIEPSHKTCAPTGSRSFLFCPLHLVASYKMQVGFDSLF
jgi:hypothetical protein